MEGFVKAPLGKRFLAFVIDYILLCILQTIIVWCVILLLIGFDFENVKSQPNVFLQGVLIGTAISFIIYCFKDIFRGVSLGRKIAKIAVRDQNNPNKIPNAAKLILRNFLLIIWPIEFLLLIINSAEGNRIGDRLFHTKVIETNKGE
jgi:uncharacterized RDD family membrane protein YckC